MSQAQGWRRLAALHHRIEQRIEQALQRSHGLNVNEYCLLHLLDQQSEHHFRMQEIADTLVLSQSATTRLVTRLEDRGLLSRYLCPDDRRGIYTDVTEEGRALLAKATPTHDAAFQEVMAEAADRPELAPLARALDSLG
jgi:DNA-binding MarR family transcriptional regulator